MTGRFTLTTAILLALAATGARADAIRIGVNEPLTGPFAASGTYVVNGAGSPPTRSTPAAGYWGRRSSSWSRTTRATRPRPRPSPRS